MCKFVCFTLLMVAFLFVSLTPLIGSEEFIVNPSAYESSVAMDEDGNFIVVWYGVNTGKRIFTQRYSSDGQKIGEEFNIYNYCECLRKPDVEMDKEGNFIITFACRGEQVSKSVVIAQTFNKDGYEMDPIRVGDFNHYDLLVDPVVAMNDSGDFVIALAGIDDVDSENSIYCLRYHWGDTRSAKTQVALIPEGKIDNVQVAMDNNGRFVVAWAGDFEDDSQDGIYVKSFDKDGTPLDEAFQNTKFNSYMHYSFAMDMNGNFILLWENGNLINSKKYGNTIFAKNFDIQCNLLGESIIEEYTDNYNVYPIYNYPNVAVSKNGNYTVTWILDYYDIFKDQITAKRFDSSGNSLSDEFIVTINPEKGLDRYALDSFSPEMNNVMNDRGDLLITWIIDNKIHAKKYGGNDQTQIDLYINRFYQFSNDDLELDMEINFAGESQLVDLYLVMINNSSGELFFYPNWSNEIDKVSFFFPQHYYTGRIPILQSTLPSLAPIIKNAGEYTFAMGLFENNTFKPLSNIATANFLYVVDCTPDMSYVPAGEFTMGFEWSEYSYQDQYPVHPVYLKSFCIDKFEYPNIQYERPIRSDSWYEAQNKCAENNKRLCTEAEWEKSCKGPESLKYPYGMEYDSKKCWSYTASQVPFYSGSNPDCVSGYGAYDMIGNFSEWVYDWYDEDYYIKSPTNNPLGPDTGFVKGRRGASYGQYSNCASRKGSYLTGSEFAIGFRCCSDIYTNSDIDGNEKSAIAYLRLIFSAEFYYHSMHEKYLSLPFLWNEGFISPELASGSIQGYNYTYSSSDANWRTFSFNANPVIPGKTGIRYFYIDQTGVLRVATGGAAASTCDPLSEE